MAVLCDLFVFLQRDQKLLKTKNGDRQKRPKRAKESKRARKGHGVCAVHYGAGNSEGRGEEAM
jgi:hypothetical protein